MPNYNEKKNCMRIKKSLTRLAKKVELTRKVLTRRKDVTDVREQPPFL